MDKNFLTSWEALAFIFAVLPGIVAIAYCYECGVKRKKPTIQDYFKLLKLAKRAQNESYNHTAGIFTPNSSKWLAALLVWIMWLIVVLVSPSFKFTIICLLISIPVSGVAYYIGKFNSTTLCL